MDTREEGKFMAHVGHKQGEVTVMEHVSQELRNCIKACTECSTICRDTVTYCLQMGGEHARPEHIWLLMDCAEICQTSAHFMMHQSPLHHATCRACAEVCERCAEDCERLGDDQVMQECAKVCRRCAESCRKMAMG
jgi:hypothetical protein